MAVAVYVENVDRVTTQLYSFTPQVVVDLKAAMLGIAQRIAQRERSSLAAHSKTGKMAGSVRTKVTAFRDLSVDAVVTVGGRRSAPYANLFERGFSGSESVRAHQRSASRGVGGADLGVAQLMSGPMRQFSVRAYERSVVYKPRGYLNAAKEAERSQTLSAIAAAVSTSVDKVALR